eukprot:7381661-Prymnesium_polylepis.1
MTRGVFKSPEVGQHTWTLYRVMATRPRDASCDAQKDRYEQVTSEGAGTWERTASASLGPGLRRDPHARLRTSHGG